MAPFDLADMAGTLPYYAIFLAIGLAFGAVLEMAGFGDSRKLAAQFYLKDLTVLKVMFTGIIVACVLIYGASALGLLDFSRVFVNPTYLLPGIVGGLVMGVGFIVGGFCPGTSVVAAATLKLDGLAFLGGVALGVWGFSETVGGYEGFWHSTFMGRFTLQELFGLPAGAVVVMLIAMALVMFFGAEIAEKAFGRKETITRASLRPTNRTKMAAAGALFASAVLVFAIGQPDAHAKWAALADSAGIELNNRAPFIHPAEVVEWKEEPSVYVRILDVRSEGDFNQFHIMDSVRVTIEHLSNEQYLKDLSQVPDNTLYFVTSNGEADATAAWKVLKGAGVNNACIIEGGINRWLEIYPPDPCVARPIPPADARDDETLAFLFTKAVGHSCYAAHPDAQFKEPPTDCYLESHPDLKRRPANDRGARPVPFANHEKPKFDRKVKMQKKSAVKGSCG